MKRLITCGIATASAASAAVGLATPASADQYGYVNELDRQGVHYNSVSEVVDLGKLACKQLRSGVSPAWAGGPALAAGYARYEAVVIVGEAVENMCPDQWPVLQAYIDGRIAPPVDI